MKLLKSYLKCEKNIFETSDSLPTIFLIRIGVNGSGKTTTIGKAN